MRRKNLRLHFKTYKLEIFNLVLQESSFEALKYKNSRIFSPITLSKAVIINVEFSTFSKFVASRSPMEKIEFLMISNFSTVHLCFIVHAVDTVYFTINKRILHIMVNMNEFRKVTLEFRRSSLKVKKSKSI